MAKLKILSSGSQGNCYIIACEKEKLILELGLPWKKILQGLDYDLTDVSSCLVSHQHQDHLNTNAFLNATKSGLGVYSCSEVQSIHPNAKVLKNGSKTQIGGFSVQPLPLEHSCECIGFIISHEECGKILFATDCSKFLYRIKGCNHILIESNWSEDVVLDNVINDNDHASHYEHHLELKDAISAIRENYSGNLMNVVLLHLSANNSDEKIFVDSVKLEVGFSNVYIAKKGLEIDLSPCEF